MAAQLKWDGDRLMLGKTKMAEVVTHQDGLKRYHLGPDDKLSSGYERKEDCRQDCETEVRDLLAKAGA